MSNKNRSSLRDFMSDKQRKKMLGLPTYHTICLRQTGVARPGKTARDKKKKPGK